MDDYRIMFPGVEPMIGWVTENRRNRAVDGEVRQVQGFMGYQLDGKRLPFDYYDPEMIAVPECGYHTSAQFFPSEPDEAITRALEKVRRMNDDCERILASINRVRGH